MEYQEADVRPPAGNGTPGDSAARFLRELRQLRNGAGLGHAELAARAHYPYDSIRAAEIGPSLPDLPVLCAFVRGCGSTTEEWEERWRSLTKTPSLPVPATRQSGQSEAAAAGARISSAAQQGEIPDPSVIMAALNRVAEEMASPGGDSAPGPAASRTPAPAAPEPPRAAPEPPRAAEDPHRAAPEPAGKPTGWDPIRVSAAWPALRHTPTVAEPARDTAPPAGAGVPWEPWEPAPWASPADPPPAPAADPQAPGGLSSASAAASAQSPGRPSRGTLVIAAALILCVLAILLAFFA